MGTKIVAPDYLEPVVGWRAWSLLAGPAGFRLRSLYYTAVWSPGEELVARCFRRPRRELKAPWRRRPAHAGPERRCACGIYAASDVGRVLAYFEDGQHLLPKDRVVGLVALWGDVLECDAGWRASHAYPVRIYLPRHTIGRRGDACELRRDLQSYGVPVDTLESAATRDLPAVLEQAATPVIRRVA